MRLQTIIAMTGTNRIGVGGQPMRQRAIPAATMIVVAGLIGVTQARLPRPIRDYRDRVSVETSVIAPLDTTVDWLGARYGARPARESAGIGSNRLGCDFRAAPASTASRCQIWTHQPQGNDQPMCVRRSAWAWGRGRDDILTYRTIRF